jgi:hypothetical protein
MKRIARTALTALAVLAVYCAPSGALACKDRLYPDHFPIAELADYDNVYVVHVVGITLSMPLSESWYMPPFSFESKILKTLKGSKKQGSSIQGSTSTGEEAMARCPVNLQKNRDYLVMLDGKGNPFILPRYGSLYVRSDDEHFDGYVADIDRFYASKRR